MNSQIPIRPFRVVAVFVLCALQTISATAADLLEHRFFPPEVLMQSREAIGLTEAQQSWLHQKVADATARATPLHQRLQRETEALAALAAAEQVDETALLAQLDQVLDAERAVKRLHLSTLAAIKNQLTPAQQAKLRALRSERGGAGADGETAAQAELRARLEGKIQRIQAGVQQWQQSGRDPAPIGRIMQEFDPLMKQGRHREAEAVLDRALAELGLGPAPKSRASTEPASTRSPPGTLLSSAPGDSHTNFNFARGTATDAAGRVHAVWHTTRDGRSQVHYRRSADGGATWGAEAPLSRAEGVSNEHPAIAVAGDAVFVVWHSIDAATKHRVWLRQSPDGGASWAAPALLCDSGTAAHPSVAAAGALVHVVWVDSRDGPREAEVFYRHSLDPGRTWQPERRLTDAPATSYVPSLAASEEVVALAWVDTRDGNEEEYIKVSTDRGATWGADTRLTDNRMNSWAPSVAVRGRTIHLAWFDQKSAPYHLLDAEANLDEAMRLVGLAPEPAPAGVMVPDAEQSAKWRATQKRQRIQEETAGWIARGGDAARLRALLDEFEALGRPSKLFRVVEEKVRAIVLLLGLDADPTALTGFDDPVAGQSRLEAVVRRIHEAAPQWLGGGGSPQRLEPLTRQFEEAMEHVQEQSSYTNKERKLDEALRLMGISFAPQAPDALRFFYADAFQTRVRHKRQQLRAAAPGWRQRGGDQRRLDALLQEFGRRTSLAAQGWEIYYRRSDDAGQTWSDEQRLVTAEHAHRPQLALVGNTLHLAWWDRRNGNDEIYLKASPDAGRTWGGERRVTDTPGESQFPMIAAGPGGVHLMWTETHAGQQQVRYLRL